MEYRGVIPGVKCLYSILKIAVLKVSVLTLSQSQRTIK